MVVVCILVFGVCECGWFDWKLVVFVKMFDVVVECLVDC